ncbi:MAG: hypothetical protein ACKO0M_06490, partial [Cyanobium sp.]
SLRAPLRELILLPALRQLCQERSPSQAAAQKDALLAELAGTFHPDVLLRLGSLLDGAIGIASSVASSPRPAPESNDQQARSIEPLRNSATDPLQTPADLLPPLARVSPQMMQRLQRIDALVQQGYTVKKAMNAFPYLNSPGGNRINPSLFSTGATAGFSWIGFFFPFVSCFQISEWSFFWVNGIAELITSLIYLATKFDATIPVDLAVGLMYGIYLPYLRYLKANQGDYRPSSLRRSIIFGLLLNILSAAPAIVIYTIAG